MWTDIFMLVLFLNALRNIDTFSYIIFVCVFIYFLIRVIILIKPKNS